MTWKTILLFIVSATLLILLSDWLIVANLLPIQTAINYSEAERSFLKIWVQREHLSFAYSASLRAREYYTARELLSSHYNEKCFFQK